MGKEEAIIHRTILSPSFSRMPDDLEKLKDALALYRLTLGQVDQDSLLHALQRRLDAEDEDGLALKQWARSGKNRSVTSTAPELGRGQR
jgi:hypothetical protein